MQPEPTVEEVADAIAVEAWRLFPHTFAHVVSGGKWEPYRHLVYMMRLVSNAIYNGGARIIVNMPPRHGKSFALSHWLPAWYIDSWPDRHVIATSYGESLASDWGRAVRDALHRSPVARARIRYDVSKTTRWLTDKGGGMRTAGVGGPITGHGGDLLILDDPYKNEEEASSATTRKHTMDWFESTLLTRAEPGASVIVVMTRWNDSDMTAELLQSHPGVWTHINMAAVADAPDEIGRSTGGALCPERYDLAALAEIKRGVGQRVWQGMYQQDPTPDGGTIFMRHWWRYWHPRGVSPIPVTEKDDDGALVEIPSIPMDGWDKAHVVQSWDLTFDDTENAAYVCGQVWATLPARPADKFLIDSVRERMDIVRTLAAIETMRAKWPRTAATYIEKKANGAAVLSMLRRKIPGLIPVEPMGGKVQRARAAAPTMESGNVFIPHPSVASWVTSFIDEHSAFPNGKYADQVDTTSQVLVQLNQAKIMRVPIMPVSTTRQSPLAAV